MLGASLAAAVQAGPLKKIASVITEYRRDSHADVIVGRLLEGYEWDGTRQKPRVRVVSMYTDQVPANDMSRAMAAKHGVRICSTVREALLADRIEGVVLIGEHGNYSENEKGQKLYPRYELYRQIVEVFRETGRVTPVFTDKHLSVDWDKAKWMYDQSRALGFPLMAGSSLPVTWRRPPLELEIEAPVEHAVVAFHGPKEAYGFHALESLQCMVERRRGGETGVAAVQCIEGPGVWAWTEAHEWAGRLLEAALAARGGEWGSGRVGEAKAQAKQPILFVLEYRDGLQAAVYMLTGYISDCLFAADVLHRREPASTLIWLQPGRPFSHFSALVHYIEQMMVTGKPAWPDERTLLTTGALAALMDPSFEKGRRLETPWLKVRYKAPKESLFARGPVPALEARR